VDSDLVAALQFDAAANESAGSPELQRAVVERAATISEKLDFRSAVPREDARRAARYAVVAVLAAAIGWFAFPDHASAFWNRLWLGNGKYPTRTQIDEVAVNSRPEEARVVEGEAVAFRVRCSGVTPPDGVARLRGMETGDSISVMLKRIGDSSDAAIYVADGPPLNEPMEFSIQIGDAETEPRRIALIQRPIVELTIAAEAPAYMQQETVRHHEHYVQVLEGSAVHLSLLCTNGKRLVQARFQLIKSGERVGDVSTVAFAATDDARLAWQLDAEASGLTRVMHDIPFRIDVVDEEGLGTFHPIEGAIRVKSDRAPAATLASLQHAILPNARPTVAYTAEDDFGVGSMVLHVRRAATQRPEADEQDSFALDLPLPETRTSVRTEHVLDLSPLNLVERDKVVVWLEVADDRGEWPGVSALSEPIELEVTDERGVLDAILRSDADAEQILTDVIEKELGLRGDR
jgi:hypothetical protein